MRDLGLIRCPYVQRPVRIVGVIALSMLLLLLSSFSGSVGANSSQRSSQTPFARALADFRTASSVHCLFSGTESSGTLIISGDVFRDGDVNGSLGIDGYSTRIIVIRGTAYELVNAALVNLIGKLCIVTNALEPLIGKWISVPNSSSNGSGSSFHFAVGTNVSFEALVQIFGQDSKSYSESGHSKIDGHQTIRFRSNLHATVWMSEGTNPYPVKVSAAVKGGGITISLSDWNKARMTSAPIGSVPISSIPLSQNT
jgi:hypothetical protein